jgi:hypothetical protein
MRKQYRVILFLVCANLLFSCGGKTHSTVFISDTSYETVEDDQFAEQPPLPSLFKSKPETLKEWFYKFCDNEIPGNSDVSYLLMILTVQNRRIIHITDLKKVANSNHGSTTSDAVNSHYWLLPIDQYKNMEEKEMLKQVKSQIFEFSKAEEFNTSSLAKARSIIIRFHNIDSIRLK